MLQYPGNQDNFMPTNLILHVGLAKTGTSSFQKTCRTNREILMSHGITYPDFKIGEKTISHNVAMSLIFADHDKSRVLARTDIGNRNKAKESVINQLSKTLNYTKNEIILISAETLASTLYEDIMALINKITKLSIEIHAYACVRKPAEYVASYMNTRIRTGTYYPNLGCGLIHECIAELNPQQIFAMPNKPVRKLKDSYQEKIKFIDFDVAKSFKNGSITGYLLKHICGIKDEIILEMKIEKSNESNSNLVVRLQNIANKITRLRNDQKKYSYATLDRSFNQGPRFQLTRKEFSVYMPSIKNAEEELLKLTGMQMKTEEICYGEDIPDDIIEKIIKQIASHKILKLY